MTRNLHAVSVKMNSTKVTKVSDPPAKFDEPCLIALAYVRVPLLLQRSSTYTVHETVVVVLVFCTDSENNHDVASV